MSFLPPFIGTISASPPVLAPVPGAPGVPVGTPPMEYSNAPYMGMPITVNGDYQAGPFCFGLDKWICQGLSKVHIGGARGSVMEMMGLGTDLDLRDSCRRLMNALCATLVLFVLLAVVAITLNSLLR